ncbi:Serine protease pic autotransporter precursor [Fusobacterium polymorphum]|uniref:Possible autotransporter n=1 Tax=Fusobacterium polymorphum ATCC 10953 TaxID=393480 RepID=A5TSH9_FUSNP|nr:autotransporter outer membrane beta-barrel domain-containing protein [Fusobacterium polymorphum]EDK87854.1 possible autotransporter [Fusobacterium polymorphum ATCC 10953]UTI53048.1 autotransporter outer membrane beta-barrel domain-containing protein [Fusobacterium polymorphum]WRL67561.1 autotransporter outer membrane beta-barrel domain-containing protein [Fusobacterium polymorphum]CKH20086.1 Serine protease pic autotransporter precursor [Fusobacterium polymorphum]
MKNSKKIYGLFAFLLVCGNVNAGSVGVPETYPGIKYDYNNVNVSLPTFNFTENLTNGGNYIRVGGNSKLSISSNLNINLKSNIVNSFSPTVYGNAVGFGAYGTNSAAPTINAKNVKIKIEVGASDDYNAPRGMIVNDGANYFGEDVDINLITNSKPKGNDIIGLNYGADDENITRAYKSEMNVNNVNIKIQNNQVLTTGYGDNLLVGLWQTGDKNQNTHFTSRGNLNIDINDKSNKAQYHAAAGIILAGDNGAKMTLNNTNIKIKSITDNDYIGGAIVLGYPDYNNSSTGVGTVLESKGKMILDTTEASNVATLNLHGQGSLFKADFENSSTEIKSGGIAIRFAGISQALNADGENTKPGKDLTISLKNAKITSTATTYDNPLIQVEDGVKNATFNLTGSQSEAKAGANNDLLLVKGKSSVTLNISDGAKISGIINRASLGEITTNITNNAVWASPANKGSSYASTLTLKDGGTFDLSDNPNPTGVNYHEIKVFNGTETDGKIINDNGIITTANTSYNDVVEIYGNYEGKNGAKIKMNTLWNSPGNANGANSKSDVIKILRSGITNSGNATGVTGIIPVGIDGKENIIDGNIKKVAKAVNSIPVIIVDKAAAGTFVGKAQTTGAGEVQLTSRLNGGKREFFWTLNAIDGSNPYDDGTSKNYDPHSSGKTVTILNSAVAGYINTAKVNMNLGFQSLATLNERRGENNFNSTDEKSQAWARILGKHTKDEGKERFNFETNVYGVQAGYDFNIKNSENGKRYTGFYFTNTEAKTNFEDRYRAENGVVVSDKYTGKTKTKDFSLGLSTTKYYNNGLYLDLAGQFSFIKNKYNSRDGVSANQKGNAFGLSVETGKSYKLGTNWVIQPQVQLVYQYLKLKDFKDDVREIHYGNDSILRGRIGLRATYNSIFYSIANVWHDFSNSTEATIGSDNIKEKYSSTSGEIGLGVQIPIINSAYVYTDLRYERSFKSNPKHNGYRGTVGFKYIF